MKIEDQEISFLTFKEAAVYNPDVYEEYTYLFSIDGQGYYLAEGIDPENFPGFELKDNQYFREARPKYRQFAAVTGWQLYRWYQSRKFCGHCGQPMVHDDKERMMRCPDCGMMEFPKICPAVIIAVTHGDKILMSKYAGREYKKYALLAGFNETGESIEETVRREVMEEVGLKVKNMRYYKSQPWSFTDTLLMGFFCELDGEDGITLDTDELPWRSGLNGISAGRGRRLKPDKRDDDGVQTRKSVKNTQNPLILQKNSAIVNLVT